MNAPSPAPLQSTTAASENQYLDKGLNLLNRSDARGGEYHTGRGGGGAISKLTDICRGTAELELLGARAGYEWVAG